MADRMHVDPDAVAAAGRRLGSTADGLRAAHTDAAGARFGPTSLTSAFAEHGAAYAAGMARLGSVVAAMATSVADLVDGFDGAATALAETDTTVARDLSSAWRDR